MPASTDTAPHLHRVTVRSACGPPDTESMPGRVRPARLASASAIATAVVVLATPSVAQITTVPQPRLQDVLPDLPGLEESEPDTGLVLPRQPVEPQPLPETEKRGPTFLLQGVAFEGNTVFTDVELMAVIADAIGRPAGIADLETLRRRLTEAYVEAGYVNSGAVLPDQRIEGGIVQFVLVEGVLGEIVVDGLERLSSTYVEDRLRLSAGPPLNVNGLQRRLRIMLDDPLIERIGAELSPGARPGESRLAVTVEEAPMAFVSTRIDNEIQPSVGGEQARLSLNVQNLTGLGEILALEPRLAEGFVEIAGLFEVPISPWDTRLTGRALYSESRIVEEPFDALDIESETYEAGIAVVQPLYRDGGQALTARLGFDHRVSKGFLDGDRFSFSEGVRDGRSAVSVLRSSLEWVDRSRKQVIAARGTTSVGLGLFGATENPGDLPDSQFVSFFGQAQYVRRLGILEATLSLRGTGQWTDDRLLSLEKFGVGGANTVRGYREDLQLGDRGWNVSLEIDIPLLETPVLFPSLDERPGQLSVVPFVDAGRAWDIEGPDNDTLVSVGAGLAWNLTPDIEAAVYVGRGLINRPDPFDDDIQDIGVHFSLSADVF